MMSNENLFYTALTPFILFFGLFAFVIYPHREVLHPAAESIALWQEKWPSLHWPLALFGVWSYAVFYVLSELWGSVVMALSFWQFANQVTHTREAKRIYSFFGLVAQFSLILSGILGDYFSNVSQNGASHMDPWQVSLNWLMGMVVVFGILAMGTYRWIYRYVLTDKRFYDKPELPGVGKGKKKAGLMESLKTICTSPYLGLIAVLVMAYGISVNVVEGLWKSQLKLRYHNENDYNTFMSQYTMCMGVASMVTLVVGGNVLRLCRWVVAAMITPLVMFLGGSLFFSFVLFRSQLADVMVHYGTNPVTVAVFLGAGMVIAAKATKYALFDLTKEMAYIPLDEDMKVKGKAVVEVVGGRFGKSGGALVQVVLFSVVGSLVGHKVTYDGIVPYIFGIFIAICLLWILSVKMLGKKVEEANRLADEMGKSAS